MADDKLVTYLKANGLYDHLHAAAEEALGKEAPGVGDVHVSSTGAGGYGKKPAPLAGTKPEDEEKADINKRLAEADVVFFKGQANLYVKRPLLEGSADRLHDWAVEQGIKNIVPPELMHVTQVHSTAEVDTDKFQPLSDIIEIGPESRWLSQLGKGNALVMFFVSQEMQDRHKQALAAGASWDFDVFMPHITISYDTGDVDAHTFGMQMAPDFQLQLGPEEFAASNDNWVEENELAKADFTTTIQVTKVDPDKQMIFGWASVSSVNGVEIVDKQDDMIPIVELEKAAYEFSLYSRQHGDMHSRVGTGRMVESMVFTPEKAAVGIMAKNENGEQIMGWWVGFKVDDANTWAEARAGRLPEFSIGGKATPVTVS